MHVGFSGFAPLGHGIRPGPLEHPVVAAIAGRTGRTPAQVRLAWAVQRGGALLTTPKTAARARENFEISRTGSAQNNILDMRGLHELLIPLSPLHPKCGPKGRPRWPSAGHRPASPATRRDARGRGGSRRRCSGRAPAPPPSSRGSGRGRVARGKGDPFQPWTPGTPSPDRDADRPLEWTPIRRCEALTPPAPLSQPPPRPPGERGAVSPEKARRALFSSSSTNLSLFSRRTGGRLGEEGRGDEGSGGTATLSIPVGFGRRRRC